MPLEIPPVTAPLEGDYTAWTLQWRVSVPEWMFPFYYNETSDILWLRAIYSGTRYRAVLSTGGSLTTFSTLNQTIEGEIKFQSLLGKYSAFVVSEDAVPKLKIFKNGILQETLNLNILLGWTRLTNNNYIVGFTYDGKYLLCYNEYAPREMALFKGS